jgi:hypothetical protein
MFMRFGSVTKNLWILPIISAVLLCGCAGGGGGGGNGSDNGTGDGVLGLKTITCGLDDSQCIRGATRSCQPAIVKYSAPDTGQYKSLVNWVLEIKGGEGYVCTYSARIESLMLNEERFEGYDPEVAEAFRQWVASFSGKSMTCQLDTFQDNPEYTLGAPGIMKKWCEGPLKDVIVGGIYGTG